MTLTEVEARFGTLTAACKALNISPQNFTKWKRIGYIPWKQQFRLAMLTEGELMPDDNDPNLIRGTNISIALNNIKEVERIMNSTASVKRKSNHATSKQ